MSTLGCMTREHPSKGVIFALRCQPGGDRRQHQDRSRPETQYINAPTPITSRFLTIFLKMNFLRPRYPLRTCYCFHLLICVCACNCVCHGTCMEIRGQMVKVSSLFHHEGPHYWTQSSVGRLLGTRCIIHWVLTHPPSSVKPRSSRWARDMGTSIQTLTGLISRCHSPSSLFLCSNFPFVF